MICYLDTTFCRSPNCQGACGRKITPEVIAGSYRTGLPLAMGYFCGWESVSSEAKPAPEDPPHVRPSDGRDDDVA